jgi:quinol-cytochrome oxidoreductase complex cytochrome b subunit
MNHIVALNLSLILLLPWYLVLGIVYWRTRRKPASAAQRGVDVASLLLALAAAALGGYWSFGQADPQAGAIWKQVLASLVGYGLFLLVLALAFLARRRGASRRR